MMDKKSHLKAALIAGVTLLLLVFSLVGCQQEERVSEDLNYRYLPTEGLEAVLTGYDGGSGYLEIPGIIDGYIITGVADGAVPDGVVALTVPDGVVLDEGALSLCTTLRYVLLPADSNATLPDGCELYTRGQVYDENENICLDGIYLDEYGALYGLLDNGEAALLMLPDDITEYVMPVTAGYSIVTYIDAGALDGATSLVSLELFDGIEFPYELYPALRELEDLSYPRDTLLSDYLLTMEAATIINEQRAEVGIEKRIEPDINIIRASRVRCGELSELVSFDRPDGSAGATALDDEGVEYRFNTAYYWHGSDLEDMEQVLIESIVSNEINVDAVLLHDYIGISSGWGPYNEHENYVSYAFLTNDTQDELTYGSLKYEYVDGELIPSELTQDNYVSVSLYGKLYGAKVGELPDGFFDGTKVKALFLASDYPDEYELPENLVAVRDGEDSGDGIIESVYVDEYGAVYVATDRDRYVLYSLPDGIESYVVFYELDDMPVTYISRNAIAYAKDLNLLYISDMCGTSPILSDILAEKNIQIYQINQAGEAVSIAADDYNTYNTLFCSLSSTADLIAESNKQRENNGQDRITSSSYELCRAAWVLAKEESESFELTRPDGSSWSTALNDEYVDYDSANILIKKYTLDNLNTLDVTAIAREFAATRDDGQLHDTVAMGVYMTESYDVYLCILGVIY